MAETVAPGPREGTTEGGAAENLLWLDMEMTGLDPATCVILEVAAIVTDPALQELGTFEAVVNQPPEALAAMDEWNTRTHNASGLASRVPGGRRLADVETDLLELVGAHFDMSRPVVLCGNSISQDRKFVDLYMPRFAACLHYRMVDVSSFKEMLRRRYGLEFKKEQRHRALGDVRESIAELGYYLDCFEKGVGTPR
ncbi:MAG: oligoribonuclease [Acidimicrobiia bacterium]|nr:oligoribonuclease [Acidimicrobiia bacterium]